MPLVQPHNTHAHSKRQHLYMGVGIFLVLTGAVVLVLWHNGKFDKAVVAKPENKIYTIAPEDIRKSQQILNDEGTVASISDQNIIFKNTAGKIMNLLLSDSTVYTSGPEGFGDGKSDLAPGANALVSYYKDTNEITALWVGYK